MCDSSAKVLVFVCLAESSALLVGTELCDFFLLC